MKHNIFFKTIIIAGGSFILIILIFTGFYTYWSAASPSKTCVRCHEISPSFNTWTASAHREISCFKCHGTALGNGFHSLKEKSRMVLTHFKTDLPFQDLRMSENQLLETMDRCKNCHGSEYSNWLASGHSAGYADIFLNETHNQTEQLNADCLRCHGMFFGKTTDELVEPLSKKGPWRLKEAEKAKQPVIPCMACHQVHSPGVTVRQPDYSSPDSIFKGRVLTNNSIGFYDRHEKSHFQLNNLPTPVMLLFGDTIKTPVDKVYRLCVQCHAPSVWHEVGSSDDHTPVGVHQGISCNACHEPHSNYQRNSCDKCHPAISNCRLDVKTMNTTFLSPSSPNDIHFVSCKNCHQKEKRFLKSAFNRSGLPKNDFVKDPAARNN